MEYLTLIIAAVAMCAVAYEYTAIRGLRRKLKAFADLENTDEPRFQKIEERLSNLENGLVPDMEAAKEAAKAMNDLNIGIAGILNYDPNVVYRKKQEGGAVNE